MSASDILALLADKPDDQAVSVRDPCRGLTRTWTRTPEVWAGDRPRMVGTEGPIGVCTVERLRNALVDLDPDGPVVVEDPCGDRWGVALVTGLGAKTVDGVEGYQDSLGRHRQRACTKTVLVLETTELGPPKYAEATA